MIRQPQDQIKLMGNLQTSVNKIMSDLTYEFTEDGKSVDVELLSTAANENYALFMRLFGDGHYLHVVSLIDTSGKIVYYDTNMSRTLHFQKLLLGHDNTVTKLSMRKTGVAEWEKIKAGFAALWHEVDKEMLGGSGHN